MTTGPTEPTGPWEDPAPDPRPTGPTGPKPDPAPASRSWWDDVSDWLKNLFRQR